MNERLFNDLSRVLAAITRLRAMIFVSHGAGIIGACLFFISFQVNSWLAMVFAVIFIQWPLKLLQADKRDYSYLREIRFLVATERCTLSEAILGFDKPTQKVLKKRLQMD